MRYLALVLAALAASLSLAAGAQQLPGRVGRLAYASGAVSLYQDPEQGWEGAFVNAPITSENSLWTNPGARAELRVAGIGVRLDSATQLDIARLDDDDFSALVVRGSVNIRVRHFDNRSRLDFASPQAGFRLMGTGRYRIDVDPENGETLLTVFSGTASMRSASGDIRVDAGRSVRVFGGASPSYVYERAGPTAFDRWADGRDAGWVEVRSTRYVSTDMTGYEELDRYGQWSDDPQFGALWYPTRVSAGWAPYREGRWTWVRPWGWTWIDDAPWGYAPFHYGRWVQVRDRWAWYPGKRELRPAWSPALVAFVGGSDFNVRIAGSNAPAVGWYPLAPWERYQPWYRADSVYVNRVNIVVRDEAPRYFRDEGRGDDWRQWNRDRGSTVIRRDNFGDRRSIAQSIVQVSAEAIRQAPSGAPDSMLPSRADFQRNRAQLNQLSEGSAPRRSGREVNVGPDSGQQQQQQQERRGPERGDRFNPVARPEFGRAQVAPALAPAQGQPALPQAQQANPIGRRPGIFPQGQPQQQPLQVQQEQQQEQVRQQQRALQGQQQQQERAAREAQQQGARQQQEQQRAQQAQQQEQQRAQQAQQLEQQRVQQEQRERGVREANRQQQLQQLQQERAAREAQRQQQEQKARQPQAPQPPPAAAPPQAAPPQPQPAQAQPAQQQQQREQQRAQREKEGKDRDDKEKDKGDGEQGERGRGRQR